MTLDMNWLPGVAFVFGPLPFADIWGQEGNPIALTLLDYQANCAQCRVAGAKCACGGRVFTDIFDIRGSTSECRYSFSCIATGNVNGAARRGRASTAANLLAYTVTVFWEPDNEAVRVGILQARTN